jgi:hypothetical protein
MKKTFKRIKLAVEPTAKIHHWIVMVYTPGKKVKGAPSYSGKYNYCMSRTEARCVKAKAPCGAIVHIFRAHHNFIEAWKVQ